MSKTASATNEEMGDFYKNLREKIQKWLNSEEGKKHKYADYLMFAPDLFHLLLKLSLDKDVSPKHKAKLAVTIAYFISPVDLIPEGIVGPVGYIDDIALTAYTLNDILNDTDPEIVKKHWAGDEDILKVVQHIIEVANEFLNKKVVNKLKNLIFK